MNLYFTHESRDSLKSFTFFIAVKTIAKLNPEHSGKFEKNSFQKLAVVVYVLQRLCKMWSFYVVVLQRTAKNRTENYNARAQPLFCLLILLFSDDPVAVAVVVS